MFGMGMGEILLILAIALIVFGPKKLPDLAKSLGKAFAEFRKATQDFKDSIDIDSDIRSVHAPFDQMHEPPVGPAPPTETTPPVGSEQAKAETPESPKTTATNTTAPTETTPPAGSEQAKAETPESPKTTAANTTAADKDPAHAEQARNPTPEPGPAQNASASSAKRTADTE